MFHRLEPVEGLPISACGNLAYARPYLAHDIPSDLQVEAYIEFENVYPSK